MADSTNTSDEGNPTEGSRLELRITALGVLARIIAKAYLRKTKADKNGVSEITLSSTQRTSVNDIGNGDGSQL